MSEATTLTVTATVVPAAPRKSVENTQIAVRAALRASLTAADTIEARATVSGVAEAVLTALASNDPKYPVALARETLGLA